MAKALVILILAAAVFGTAGYFAYEMFVKPEKALREEKQRGPEPPPPDSALPEFNACVEVKKKGDLIAARTAFERFLGQHPLSSKVDAARDELGEINADIFFSQAPAPEKQVYIVKSGDVLNRVAMRTKTTPELIMRSNNLTGVMLRIGQKLVLSPADFSVLINVQDERVTLFNGKRFFKQYRIKDIPDGSATKKTSSSTPATRKIGKVVDKIATDATGNRVNFQDKAYATASHRISVSIPGYSLYTARPAANGANPSPAQTGIGMALEDLQEIAVLLTKNDPVTIE